MEQPVFSPQPGQEHDKHVIQALADQCARQGGGTVRIPAGDWASGPIRLHSHTTLELAEGARIVFSDCPEDYLPVVFVRWEGTECYNYSPLIYAKDETDIAVTGKGALYGSGQAWWPWKKLQQAAAMKLYEDAWRGVPVEERVYGTREAALRPSFIQLIGCRDVRLEDFTITEGPQWTIHPVYCENVIIRGVTVRTSGPNTDGINPDSCTNVLIENCDLSTGDDCIAVNAGLNEDGWRVARPCSRVEIRNCRMSGGHGALTIGSAVSGGVIDVHAHHCDITGTMQGIRLKSMRGRGGYVRCVDIHDITINHVTDEAVQINMFYGSSTVPPHTEKPSDFRDIRIRNVFGEGAAVGVEIKGLPEHPLSDLTLEDIRLAADTGMTVSNAEGLAMRDVTPLQKEQ